LGSRLRLNTTAAPPWTAEEARPNCFIGRDANGQAISYV
jgi:hypothetical protein